MPGMPKKWWLAATSQHEYTSMLTVERHTTVKEDKYLTGRVFWTV